MRMYQAQTKKKEECPEYMRCCTDSEKSLATNQGMDLMVDADDTYSAPGECGFCKKSWGQLILIRIVGAADLDRIGRLVDIEWLHVATEEFVMPVTLNRTYSA